MITFKIWTEDEPERVEIKADSRDVCVWEKTSKTGETYRDVLLSVSIQKFYRLAWIAARRLGVIDAKTCPLKTFETDYMLAVPTIRSGMDDVEVADEDDDDEDDAVSGGSAELALIEDADAHTPTGAGVSSAT